MPVTRLIWRRGWITAWTSTGMVDLSGMYLAILFHNI